MYLSMLMQAVMRECEKRDPAARTRLTRHRGRDTFSADLSDMDRNSTTRGDADE